MFERFDFYGAPDIERELVEFKDTGGRYSNVAIARAQRPKTLSRTKRVKPTFNPNAGFGNFYHLKTPFEMEYFFYRTGTLRNGHAVGYQVDIDYTTDFRPGNIKSKSIPQVDFRGSGAIWKPIDKRNIPSNVISKFRTVMENVIMYGNKFDFYGAPDIDREMNRLEEEPKFTGRQKGRMFQVFPYAPPPSVADKPVRSRKRQSEPPVSSKKSSDNFFKLLMRTSVMDELKRAFPKLSARDIEKAIRGQKASGDAAKVKKRYSELMRKAFKEHIETAISEAKRVPFRVYNPKGFEGAYENERAAIAAAKRESKKRGVEHRVVVASPVGYPGKGEGEMIARFNSRGRRVKEEIEAELAVLESTDSPFPEVRERRIEALKSELKEANRVEEARTPSWKSWKKGAISYTDALRGLTQAVAAGNQKWIAAHKKSAAFFSPDKEGAKDPRIAAAIRDGERMRSKKESVDVRAQRIIDSMDWLEEKKDLHIAVREMPPVLQRALKQVGYGRKDVIVEPSTEVNISGLSGAGRRAFAIAVDLASGRISDVAHGSWGGPNPYETNPLDVRDAKTKVPVNGAVIRGIQGGDRPVYAVVHIHPGSLAKLLPSGGGDVTEKESHALEIVASRKSSYRKEEFRRLKITQQDLDSLVSRGYLKKNKSGAISITTKGKNSRSGRLPLGY